MSRSDWGRGCKGRFVNHIRKAEPHAHVHTSVGDIPIYKTLCGLDAIVSMLDEKNPTCKTCIRVREKMEGEKNVPS